MWARYSFESDWFWIQISQMISNKSNKDEASVWYTCPSVLFINGICKVLEGIKKGRNYGMVIKWKQFSSLTKRNKYCLQLRKRYGISCITFHFHFEVCNTYRAMYFISFLWTQSAVAFRLYLSLGIFLELTQSCIQSR